MKTRKKCSRERYDNTINRTLEVSDLYSWAWKKYPKERKLILKIIKLKLKKLHIYNEISIHRIAHYDLLYRRNKILFLFEIMTLKKDLYYEYKYKLYINHKNQIKLFSVRDLAIRGRNKALVFNSIDSLIAFLLI